MVTSTDSGVAGRAAGALETRGIEPVPVAERTGRPGQLFWVWFAANISILGLPLGATLVAVQGLTVWQAVLVAAVGSVGSFAIVGGRVHRWPARRGTRADAVPRGVRRARATSARRRSR